MSLSAHCLLETAQTDLRGADAYLTRAEGMKHPVNVVALKQLALDAARTARSTLGRFERALENELCEVQEQ